MKTDPPSWLHRPGCFSLTAAHVVALTVCIFLASPAFAAETPYRDARVKEARRLWLRGRYAESEAACRKLLKQSPAAAILLARTLHEQGRSDEAQKTLQDSLEHFDDAEALLHAELAQLTLARGDYVAAANSAILGAQSKEPAPSISATWVLAELHRVQGQLESAEKMYQDLIDRVRDEWVDADPESMLLLTRAALQQARRQGQSQRFKTVVSQMLPAITKREPQFWPAFQLGSEIYAEKFNLAQAKAEQDQVLTINPNAVPALVLRGQIAVDRFDFARAEASIARVRRVDANSTDAIQLEAQLDLLRWNYSAAVARLKTAQANRPHNQRTLAMLAAAIWAEAGAHREPNDEVQGLIDQVVQSNPHCSEFFEEIGSQLDAMRKYPFAAPMFRRAIAVDPKRIGPRAQLGLILMRLGQEEEAAKLLTESFKLDPYNVRVKNMLEVLDVLKNYAVLETEHFILRFDRGVDGVLAENAAYHLEEVVYPQVTKQLGFEPKGKTLFEIFSNSKNSNAHSWFSARMVGLPFIGTVGACAGKMVALTSPNNVRQKFNWARLLKHEFVHVVNLQQTNFHVPHWFTEAIAVRVERPDRPPEWGELLARRRAANRLFNLDTINLGFIRPQNSDDWTLAYCQSELYADYLAETYGEDALTRLLAAFARNETIDAALQSATKASKAQVEAGYSKYVANIVSLIHSQTKLETPLEERRKRAELEPNNASVQAELAAALLERNRKPDARRSALAALKIESENPLAQYVMARLELSIGDQASALARLEKVYDSDSPNERILVLLAALRMKQKDYLDAVMIFENGAKHFPHPTRWQKHLARAHLKSGDEKALYEVLTAITALDDANLLYRRKLIQMAQQQANYEDVVKWTNQCLQIDVMDAEHHAAKGEAHLQLNEAQQAARFLEIATKLSPDRITWRVSLARAYAAGGDKNKAQQLLQALSKEAPDNMDVKRAVKELNR